MNNELCGYICFYKDKRLEVYATSSYQAQLQAANLFKAKKRYEVSVHLAELPDGSVYEHTATN